MENSMAQPPNSYFDAASRYQQAKIAERETLADASFVAAKGQLKTAFASYRVDHQVNPSQLAKTHFTDASVQEKATRKFTEWMKKQPQAAPNAKSLAEASPEFEKAYLASKESEPVMAARAAKREFKQLTKTRLTSGEPVETLTVELASLSDKTRAKVAYWATKFKPVDPSAFHGIV